MEIKLVCRHRWMGKETSLNLTTLKRLLRLTWSVFYQQFGVDPAKSNDKFTVRNFRADCLRELKTN